MTVLAKVIAAAPECARAHVAVDGRALLKAMRIMGAVSERRSSIPVLACVRLEVKRAAMIVTASDLDIEASVELDIIDAAGEWQACVDCRTLTRIAAVAGFMPVRIDAPEEDGRINIRLGDGEADYEVCVQPADTFPSMAGGRGDVIERFTNGQLAAIFDKVAPCISDEYARYYLNGIAWQASTGGGHRMAATDGHRMAICRYDGGEFSDISESRIIPRKAVNLLRRFTAGQDVALHSVEASPLRIDVSWPGVAVRLKLIDGTYPNIDRVIPKIDDCALTVALNPAEAKAAINRVLPMAARLRSVALKFERRGGRIEVSTRNPDFGSAKAIFGTAWKGGVSDFGFNARYVSELLGACSGAVAMSAPSQSGPFVITDDDGSMTRVLMPMRV